MLTFRQFLTEKFFTGVDSRYGYCEVWKNPSLSEVRELAKNTSQLGAWLVGKDLFVWNRDDGEHGDVKSEIVRGKDALPLYIYFKGRDNSAKVSFAAFSMNGAGHAGWGDKEVKELMASVKKLPAFKVFSSVSYY